LREYRRSGAVARSTQEGSVNDERADARVQLDNNLAALVLGETAGLELRVPMRWEMRATTVRAQMGVHNAYDLPLFLGVQVLIPKPWKLTPI
jgi:hypothetical protein